MERLHGTGAVSALGPQQQDAGSRGLTIESISQADPVISGQMHTAGRSVFLEPQSGLWKEQAQRLHQGTRVAE